MTCLEHRSNEEVLFQSHSHLKIHVIFYTCIKYQAYRNKLILQLCTGNRDASTEAQGPRGDM